MANVMSIAALVTSWRNHVVHPDPVASSYATSVGYSDPSWCIDLNIASLVCGIVGNLFLLFNFTTAVRYIIALPMTILLWYAATSILIGITISMDRFAPPGPDDVYSQGFWHAVIAACLYMFSSMILMINMLGYVLGHYPQHFTLTDDQRNLILQTMMFFAWLAIGGAIFSNIMPWSFVDALYFCDVTILTVGFGDFYSTNDLGRGIVFPYSVGGIIILGLMVSSIHRFAGELGQDKVIQNHINRRRQMTLKRSVTISEGDQEKQIQNGVTPSISSPSNPRKLQSNSRTIKFQDPEVGANLRQATISGPVKRSGTFHKTMKIVKAPLRNRKPKILIMREEKDRFDAMRDIQRATATFKKWFALSISVTAFGILWCVGAVVFWQAEAPTQQLSYFQALYFCYVSLLTIGYGDLSPRSNAGKPFFILWSLIAVPTMTILISDMGDTVIASFKQGTFTLADWTVMPKKGIYRAFMLRNPWLWNWLQRRAEKRRIKKGFETGFENNDLPTPSIDELARQETLTEGELTRQLAFAIRKTADDLMRRTTRRYSYEDWVEFTRLIRFTSSNSAEVEEDEEEHGVINWDWIGDDSPMLSDQSETEWVLDRLCESLLRLLKKERVRDKLDVLPENIGMSLGLNTDKHTDLGIPGAQTRAKQDWTATKTDATKEDQISSSNSAAENDQDAPGPDSAPPHHTEFSDGPFRSRVSSRGVDPMHRGIGLYPELDTTPLEQPSPGTSLRQERPSYFDRRRSSGVAPSSLGASPGGSQDARRRSSGGGSPGTGLTNTRARRGPFSALPARKKRSLEMRTLKHRTYVNN